MNFRKLLIVSCFFVTPPTGRPCVLAMLAAPTLWALPNTELTSNFVLKVSVRRTRSGIFCDSSVTVERGRVGENHSPTRWSGTRSLGPGENGTSGLANSGHAVDRSGHVSHPERFLIRYIRAEILLK